MNGQTEVNDESRAEGQSLLSVGFAVMLEQMERDAFEKWMCPDGKWLKAIERIGDSYKYAQAATAWTTWQARAALNKPCHEIEHLRRTVAKLSALAQHSDKCSWITPMPTGQGYWGCDCGLDHLVLDGEPTDAALTPNVV